MPTIQLTVSETVMRYVRTEAAVYGVAPQDVMRAVLNDWAETPRAIEPSRASGGTPRCDAVAPFREWLMAQRAYKPRGATTAASVIRRAARETGIALAKLATKAARKELRAWAAKGKDPRERGNRGTIVRLFLAFLDAAT